MAKQSGATEPQPNAGRQPNMDDVQAIGNAATGAATTSVETGATPEAAGQAAAEAARAEAADRNIHLPDEVVQQIAKASATAVVAELAAQGALTHGEPEPPADQQQQPADQPPAAEREPEQPPAKKTFAQKVLGSYS